MKFESIPTLPEVTKPDGPKIEDPKEKENTEKIEKIRKLAEEIKKLYESMPDKSVLNKYFDSPESLHNQIYQVAFWTGAYSKEKPFKNNAEESNTILENIGSIAEQAFQNVAEKSEGGGDYDNLVESLDILKEKLELISKTEDIEK